MISSLVFLFFYSSLVFLTKTTLTYARHNSHSNCLASLQQISSPARISQLTSNNFSHANSVSYSKGGKMVLIAGDFADKAKSDKYYSFVTGYEDTMNEGLISKWFDQWESPAPPMDASLLRTFTRVIAHPTLDVLFVVGNKLLRAMRASDGALLWDISNTLTSCGGEDTTSIKYDDATFMPTKMNEILVSGVCNNSQTVVIDTYNITQGQFLRRNHFSVYEIMPKMSSKVNFGIIPCEVSISAPPNADIFNKSHETFYYLSISHFVFSGVARVDISSNNEATINWTANTFVNPSMFVHKGVVADNDNGVVTLLDPSHMDILTGKWKHLTRYEFEYVMNRKTGGQWIESVSYSEFVWYGQHQKVNYHYDWSLVMDNIWNKHVYVITAPFDVPMSKSFIAQHNVSDGIYTAVATIPFVALDMCVTELNHLITVGFEFRKSPDSFYFLQRHAVVSVLHGQGNSSVCGGCRSMYYGANCSYSCDCLNGYCSDDLTGTGECYCTMTTYGKTCEPCLCGVGTGICNSGPDGDGLCKLCYDLDVSKAEQSIGWPMTYGPLCENITRCDPALGLSDPRGEDGTDGCIYCNNSQNYGTYCNLTCGCGSHQECDNGPQGLGCVEKESDNMSYGGISFPYQWIVYSCTAVVMFIGFFIMTYQQAKKTSSKQLPWCPSKKGKKGKKDNTKPLIFKT